MLIQMLSQHPIRYFQLIVVIILSICLHELAHGAAALSQGDDTPRQTGHMTLNPFVHMGWESIIFLCIGGIAWGAMPVNSAKFRSRQWGDILVSAAGPACNLVLGFIFVGFLAIAMRVEFLSVEFFRLGAQINFVLCLFKLLPIPPLDGFYVFSKFFPALKVLDGSQFGLFALMLLFISGLGTTLYTASDLLIRALLG